MKTHFQIDYIALIISILGCILFFFIKRFQKQNLEPKLPFSDLQDLKIETPSVKEYFANIPRTLSYLALFFFILAFLDPHLFIPRPLSDLNDKEKEIPTEGIAIYLLLDQSGSMGKYVVTNSSKGEEELITKKDLLKQVTQEFIEGNPEKNLSGRSNDLIGLVTFARVPHILSPLTLDHELLLKQLNELDIVHKPDEDGTATGYAIFKTVHLISSVKHFGETLIEKGNSAYTIKNSIIIVVTDGFQNPSQLDKGKRLRNIDLNEAAQYAKDNHIKIYFVNIDPRISEKEFTPQRNQMKRIAESTGGKFFIMSDTNNLASIYSEIDKLEKSVLPENTVLDSAKQRDLKNYKRLSFYPFLIVCGLISLFGSVLLQTTVLKRVP